MAVDKFFHQIWRYGIEFPKLAKLCDDLFLALIIAFFYETLYCSSIYCELAIP